MLLNIFALFLVFRSIQAEKIGCPQKSIKDWDCDTFKYYFSAKRLEDTLYCIGYDTMSPPRIAMNKTEPTKLMISRRIDHLNGLQEESNLVSFNEWFVVNFQDDRLKSNCNSTSKFIEYSGDYLWYFFPRYYFKDSGIFLDNFKAVLFSHQAGVISSGSFHRADIPCHMDFSLFPFDEQECEINLPFGKIGKN